MPKRNKPKLMALVKSNTTALQFDPPQSAMSRWQPELKAASNDDDASTLNMYAAIGEDYWTGQGITPDLVSRFLAANKGQGVTININSPGGSFFDGNAIYNLLRDHDAEVTVRVVGLAASAASVIAMAGDTIQVAESGFIMIHNAWMCLCGNKEDMLGMAEFLSKIDTSMASVYAKKTGMADTEIVGMMDDETWITGPDAVDQGFADSLLDADAVALAVDAKTKHNVTLRAADNALAKAGMSRSERRTMLKELTGMPGAAEDSKPGAGMDDELVEALKSLSQSIKS